MREPQDRAVPGSIVIVDTSRISPGRLAEVKAAMTELAAFAEANESRTAVYQVHLDESGEHVTVIQAHPDAASAEFHMTVAAPAFAPFADLLVLQRIDVYGSPSEALLEQLRRKAHLLGDAPLAVHPMHAGFSRFGVD
jgi:quinol monooxygenase YgiN